MAIEISLALVPTEDPRQTMVRLQIAGRQGRCGPFVASTRVEVPDGPKSKLLDIELVRWMLFNFSIS
jgi:hypothetical protein